MEKVYFTQFSKFEFQDMFRQELTTFFSDKRNLEAMRDMLRVFPYDDEKPIEDIDLSVRAYNGLKSIGVTNFGQMKGLTEKEVYAIRGVSKKTWNEIQDVINKF